MKLLIRILLILATEFAVVYAIAQPATYTNTEFHDVYKPKNGTDKPKNKPKNVILLIGDGTGLAQLYSAYSTNKGQLNVFNITNIGLSITVSSSGYITDSAAGATAMSSGTKTKNRYVGVDSAKQRLTLITDHMRNRGYRIAIISNGDITDATPASFYAHQAERSLSEPIAADFMASQSDILIGAGLKSFNARKDNRDLLMELSKAGYGVSTNFNDIDAISQQKFIILDDSAVVSKLKGRKDFLQRSLNKTLKVLSSSKQPFFIMEEGAQIDWGGHRNNLEYVVKEALDFDKVIGDALRFADANNETLVIVTADHETGGLSLVDGNITNGTVQGSFSTGHHTGIAVPVFAYGPGAEIFRGVYQNTEIFWKLKTLLGL